jgi:predicted  nucleic acid-binding Zn-ribbon protein
MVEEIAAKLEANPNASVEGEVMQFVVDKIRAKSEGTSKHAEALDRAIDERVRELYFDQQIRGMQELIKSLEKQLSDTVTMNKALSGENETLKMQIKALEEEVQTVAGLREKILSK